jgi:hypothetical protein
MGRRRLQGSDGGEETEGMKSINSRRRNGRRGSRLGFVQASGSRPVARGRCGRERRERAGWRLHARASCLVRHRGLERGARADAERLGSVNRGEHRGGVQAGRAGGRARLARLAPCARGFSRCQGERSGRGKERLGERRGKEAGDGGGCLE